MKYASDDYIRKLYYYKNFGVREYWIVDPKRKTVPVNYFEEELLNVPYTFDSIIKVNIYEDLYIDFSHITNTLSLWSITIYHSKISKLKIDMLLHWYHSNLLHTNRSTHKLIKFKKLSL